MKERIKRINDPEIELQRRLLQLLSCIALTEFIIVSIYTVVSGADIEHCTLMITGTICFGLCVHITFSLGMIREGSAASALLYFLLYLVTFFDSGGMYGGAPVVFVFALVFVYLVTRGAARIALMAICIGATAVCYVKSYLHPEILSRHTVLAEHIESLLAIFLATLLLCMLFGFVTAVYRHENRIVSEQKKEIEKLHQAQKKFFSSMSHEIRTPVNAIIGFNEMNIKELSDGAAAAQAAYIGGDSMTGQKRVFPDDLREELLDNSQNIEVAGRMLLHTINEILDMSRLETGGIEIRVASYSPAGILSDLVSMIWMSADKKGLDFAVEAKPGLPASLIGDEVRIKQILVNVLTNAVKYTREGSVKLTVSGRQEPDGSFLLLFDVSDTGTGIREEDIPYLFSAYSRMDEENTHHIEGTGLGLSIVKQLLDMMNGTVTVTSEYGKGSNFHIEIPQQIADSIPDNTEAYKGVTEREEAGTYTSIYVGTEDARNNSGYMPGSGRGKTVGNGNNEDADISALRVLAVDDTRMNLMVLRKLLRDTGAALDTAESGMDALEKTLTTHYDVILMDHQMPEMDGIECLGRIRMQEGGMCKDSRIVCLTANAGPEMKSFYLDAGFDGYLEKPLKAGLLEAELVSLTRQSRK